VNKDIVNSKKDVKENSKKNESGIELLLNNGKGNLKKFKQDPKKLEKNLLVMQNLKQMLVKKN